MSCLVFLHFASELFHALIVQSNNKSIKFQNETDILEDNRKGEKRGNHSSFTGTLIK